MNLGFQHIRRQLRWFAALAAVVFLTLASGAVFAASALAESGSADKCCCKSSSASSSASGEMNPCAHAGPSGECPCHVAPADAWPPNDVLGLAAQTGSWAPVAMTPRSHTLEGPRARAAVRRAVVAPTHTPTPSQPLYLLHSILLL